MIANTPEKLPDNRTQPSCELSPQDLEISYQQPLMDNGHSIVDAHSVDSFHSFAAVHVQTMLSKMVAEHQSRVYALQSEINSLHEKLWNAQEQPEQGLKINLHCEDITHDKDTTCPFHFDTMLPEHNTGILVQSAKPEQRDTDAVKVDWATAYSRQASCAHLDAVIHDGGSELSQSQSHSHYVCWQQQLRNFILSHTFELLTGGIIVANTIMMAMQAQYDGLDTGYILRRDTYTKPASELWPNAVNVFRYFDLIFNTLFCAELLLRCYAHRFASICMAWLWFDTVIVVMGLLDLATGDVEIGINPTMIRLVRLVRLVRLLKIFKAMSSFDSLFLLLKAISSSIHALGWSFLLLGGVQTGIALFLSQMLHSFMTDDDKDIIVRDRAFQYFGTFSRAMMTMFEITLANWVPVCRFLVEEVHELYFLFFLVYRCLFCFSVLKVIAAVFISETNRVLASDVELTLMKAHRDKQSFDQKFDSVLKVIDVDGDGTITWSEMQTFLSNPELCTWLATIGVDKTDFEKVFWLLEVDESVKIEKFLSMVGQLKGQAKTVDLLNLFKLMHSIDEKLHKVVNMEEDSQEQALASLNEGTDIVKSHGRK